MYTALIYNLGQPEEQEKHRYAVAAPKLAKALIKLRAQLDNDTKARIDQILDDEGFRL